MKTTTIVLSALLVTTNAWWIYRNIDQEVTNMYREQERYESANRVVALSAIAEQSVKGKSKQEVIALLKSLLPEDSPFEKDGALHMPWIELPLSEDGHILGIHLDQGAKETAKPYGAKSR
jgi:hypothetical protein